MNDKPWVDYTSQVRMQGRGFIFELFEPPKVLPVYKSHAYKTHAQASAAAAEEIRRRHAE